MKKALTARLTQIIVRIVGLVLAGMGLGELSPELMDTINGFAGATVTLVVAVVLIVWDFMTHKVQTGGVMKPAGTTKDGA